MIAQVEWASAAVAIALILFVAGVMVVAMLRYSFSQALQIWGALGSIVGVMVGVMATYFFTQPVIRDLRERVAHSEPIIEELEARLALAESGRPEGLTVTEWRAVQDSLRSTLIRAMEIPLAPEGECSDVPASSPGLGDDDGTGLDEPAPISPESPDGGS